MNYFDKILGGNIPVNVIESLLGYQDTLRLSYTLPYFRISTRMETPSVPIKNSIILSKHSSIINTGVGLNRDKIMRGTAKILDTSLQTAFSKNKDQLEAVMLLNHTSNTRISVIINFINSFSLSIMEELERANVNCGLKSLMTDLIDLSGITSKSRQEIDQIYSKLNMELGVFPSFKINNHVNIFNIITNRLINSGCDRVTFDCLFTVQYVDELASMVVNVIELILNSFMNNVNNNKVPLLYNLSIEVARVLSHGSTISEKTVEEFAISTGNTTINVDNTRVNDLKEIEKDIDQSKVISGMTNLLSKAINNAASKNQADLVKAISASNKIRINSAKSTTGGFELRNITQTAKVDTTTEANFVQNIQNKVVNDIANELKESIDMLQKDSIQQMNKTAVDEKTGTTLGEVLNNVVDMVGGTIGKLADTAADILSVNVGNTTENRTDTEITNSLKDKFNLKQDFNYTKSSDIRNDLETLLSSDNLAKCAEDSKLANEIDIGSIDVSGPITISEIKQEAVINSITNCIFNQSVLNDISTKMVTSQEQLIKQLIENVSDTVTDEQRALMQGDIYAAGIAGSALISSAGGAVSEVTKSAGEAAGAVASGLTMPLLILGGLSIIGGAVMYYFKSQGSGNTADDDEESD